MRLGSTQSSASPPRASFSIGSDRSSGAFVMVYSPDSVYNARLAVRMAWNPEGPWSAPVEVALPGVLIESAM